MDHQVQMVRQELLVHPEQVVETEVQEQVE
jgi:hypothetical protein